MSHYATRRVVKSSIFTRTTNNIGFRKKQPVITKTITCFAALSPPLSHQPPGNARMAEVRGSTKTKRPREEIWGQYKKAVYTNTGQIDADNLSRSHNPKFPRLASQCSPPEAIRTSMSRGLRGLVIKRYDVKMNSKDGEMLDRCRTWSTHPLPHHLSHQRGKTSSSQRERRQSAHHKVLHVGICSRSG